MSDRIDALTTLLNKFKIDEGHGWLKAVYQDPDDGKMYCDFSKLCIPLEDNVCIPFPEHALTNVTHELNMKIMHAAWARMSSMPLFSCFLIGAPTVATMLTGVRDTAVIDEIDAGIAELDELYGRLLREHGGDETSFYETEMARKIIDGALLATSKRDIMLREYKTHAPMGWAPLVNTAEVCVYYSRVIDILSASAVFTSEHAPNWRAQQERIKVANAAMSTNINVELNKVVNALNVHLTSARNNIAGSYFFGVNEEEVLPIIEKGCIDFTYGVLAEMERWILTMAQIPHELHASLMCTAQPRVGIDCGPLADKETVWQDDLRKLREEAYPSLWPPYAFREEMNGEKEDLIHLCRLQYKMAVFGTLVRMTYDDNTLETMAYQYSLRTLDDVSLADLSPVTNVPLVIYGEETIDCESLFRE